LCRVFSQAEGSIRASSVTGVTTSALPTCWPRHVATYSSRPRPSMLGRGRLEYVATWWGQRVLPAGVAPSNAAVAVTPPAPAPAAAIVAVPPPPRPSLARLLDGGSVDRDAALAGLFARWGIEFQPRPGESACEIA